MTHHPREPFEPAAEDDNNWDTISHLGSIETGAISSTWQISSATAAAPPPKWNHFDPEHRNSNDGGPKISDAITYGPRFCQIFKEYTSTLPVPVNSNRHLMSLCTDHLIPFCKWARETEAQATSIHATLLDHDYLRPEVRNGIVIVLIYTFAAVKALKDTNLDMFRTLEDTESGTKQDIVCCQEWFDKFPPIVHVTLLPEVPMLHCCFLPVILLPLAPVCFHT